MSGTGTSLLDFGAFPGATDASLAVTGQTGIVAGSLVEAWVLPADTADHLADEHRVEQLNVYASTIVAGTGFTIYGTFEGTVNEPVAIIQHAHLFNFAVAAASLAPIQANPGTMTDLGGAGITLYGKWNIAWAWV